MLRYLLAGTFLLICTIGLAPRQAEAQPLVLPCVASGINCVPVSSTNPLPTTGGVTFPPAGCATANGVIFNNATPCDTGFTYAGNNGAVVMGGAFRQPNGVNLEYGGCSWVSNVWTCGITINGGTARNFQISATNPVSSGAFLALNSNGSASIGIGGVGNEVSMATSGGLTINSGVLNIGGTTSSFPGLRNTGSALNIRLADNTADANINMATATLSGQLVVTTMTQTAAAQSGTLCYNSGTGAVTYDSTVGCLTSTIAAKDDWRQISPHQALGIVTKLEAGSFTYKLGLGLPDGPQVGLNAQQVAEIDTRLVGYAPNGTLRGVRYQQTSALYGPAIRALNDDIETLRSELHALKLLVGP